MYEIKVAEMAMLGLAARVPGALVCAKRFYKCVCVSVI